MAVRINTDLYQAVHGHKPRQPRDGSISGWAFQIDDNTLPVLITNYYREALKRAKSLAQHLVTVLP